MSTWIIFCIVFDFEFTVCYKLVSRLFFSSHKFTYVMYEIIFFWAETLDFILLSQKSNTRIRQKVYNKKNYMCVCKTYTKKKFTGKTTHNTTNEHTTTRVDLQQQTRVAKCSNRRDGTYTSKCVFLRFSRFSE